MKMPPRTNRSGSKADMCSAKADVRFGSEADICSATPHVRFTPKADITNRSYNTRSTVLGPSSMGVDKHKQVERRQQVLQLDFP